VADNVVIRAEGLGKKYLIGHQAERERYVALRDAMARGASNFWRKTVGMARGRAVVAGDAIEEFWALKDVSFEVKHGEVLGIIGRNGAGKSTLLKILSRITEPTKGRVTINGRVASLLEVGTGFHPELTGRENIYLNGAILGMTRAEIRRKFDEIVAFAQVEKFLDTPVKRYSSGMYVRLAFAVAAHLEPEILVVDEVLAVGDAEFQNKCIGKMSEVARGGRTVLFVSHNMPSVQQLCSSGMMLHVGTVAMRGGIEDTIAAYIGSLARVSDQELRLRKDRTGNGRLRVVGVTLHDDCGVRVAAAVCGFPLRLRIHYESEFQGSSRGVYVSFNLRNSFGMRLTCFDNRQTGDTKMVLYPLGYFECRWPKVNLRSGQYGANIYVALGDDVSDWIKDAFVLDVEEGNFFGSGNLVQRDQGDVVFEQSWSGSPADVKTRDAAQTRVYD
jgi:lipopolysaccharide transport system ATP-binding protein